MRLELKWDIFRMKVKFWSQLDYSYRPCLFSLFSFKDLELCMSKIILFLMMQTSDIRNGNNSINNNILLFLQFKLFLYSCTCIRIWGTRLKGMINSGLYILWFFQFQMVWHVMDQIDCQSPLLSSLFSFWVVLRSNHSWTSLLKNTPPSFFPYKLDSWM